MATVAARPRRRRPISRTQLVRRIVQASFLGFIVFAALRHNLFEEATSASIDALCPFGGVETLWTLDHDRRVCAQDAPLQLRAAHRAAAGDHRQRRGLLRLDLPLRHAAGCADLAARTCCASRPSACRDKLDRWLRYGRYVTLALILYMTISTVKLWFADYDPYRTIFGLGWIFEFNAVEQWPAYTIALAILGASFFIPRFWCKYTCPLGGALSLLSHVSLLRIRRTESACKGCALCARPCPVGIEVEKANPLVSTNCIGCLECVETCPRHGALEVAVHAEALA
jgi:NAD-dependent dihydropyrimidine dehydrogenase PreA subunit